MLAASHTPGMIVLVRYVAANGQTEPPLAPENLTLLLADTQATA